MIRYTTGNILDSEAQALVNTVNTVGVMGKGLALQFKEQFPENYKKYRDECKRKALKVGQMFITTENTINGQKIIVNFPTKTTWREPSQYSYISTGLIALREEIATRGIKSIAIPPLGSRNGGLDWDRVKAMIVDALANVDCDIIIYEPNETIIDRMKSEKVKLTPARAMMLDVLCDMITQGEFASEFAAEKVVYFLQRFGAKDIFNLDFKPAYYGPYSGKVRYVLRYLNGSYIMGLGEMSQKPFEPIWILSETKEDVSKYIREDGNKRFAEISDMTKTFLDGFYSNYSLELLSTTDYILNHDPLLAEWYRQDLSSVINTVHQDVSKWNTRKDRLFGEDKHIKIVVEHLYAWHKVFMEKH